jgi:hypothetical protein
MVTQMVLLLLGLLALALMLKIIHDDDDLPR